MTLLYIQASQPQHTDAGRLVGKLYYNGLLSTLLAPGEYSGYPHNGGEHTLHLRLAPTDFKAFLDVVSATYARHPGLAEFIQMCKANALKRYPNAGAVLH